MRRSSRRQHDVFARSIEIRPHGREARSRFGLRGRHGRRSPPSRRCFRNIGRRANEPPMTARLDLCFQRLAADRRAALVTYIMAGDPDAETSSAILAALPAAGADVVELGIPFTDPIADGPAIQAAGRRALEADQTLRATLEMAKQVPREGSGHAAHLDGLLQPNLCLRGRDVPEPTPKTAGVDGLIVVDCPPEEDDEVCLPARRAGLAFVRLVAPTTDEDRSADYSEQRRRLRLLCFDHRSDRSRRAERQTGGRGRGATEAAHKAAGRGRVWGEERRKRRPRSQKPPTAWWSVRRLSRRSDCR